MSERDEHGHTQGNEQTAGGPKAHAGRTTEQLLNASGLGELITAYARRAPELGLPTYPEVLSAALDRVVRRANDQADSDGPSVS